MSQPTKAELERLRDMEGDDESYHGTFDDLLEAKLMQLDPKWMRKMKAIYEQSGMARWCA